jgi:hypothetical protein
VDNEGCEYVRLRYGGHPLLMRLACSWEHQRLASAGAKRPVTLTVDALRQTESDRDHDLIQYVKHVVEVLRRWFPQELDLLRTLAAGEVAVFREYAADLPESVQHLRAYNLLDASGERISIGVVQSYLRSLDAGRSRAGGSGEISVKERQPAVGTEEWLRLLSDLNSLRNRLEPKLRRFVRLILVSQLGPERWIDPVMKSIPSSRREQLQGVDRDEILNNRLFLLDLLQIMASEWERFKHLEAREPQKRLTRASLTVLLEFVNAQRQDAHAKPTDSDDVTATALACQALENAIADYLI